MIWWLVTFAVLAYDASVLSPLATDLDGLSDFFIGDARGIYQHLKTATNLLKASAGIAALEWLLFVASLVFLGKSSVSNA